MIQIQVVVESDEVEGQKVIAVEARQLFSEHHTKEEGVIAKAVLAAVNHLIEAAQERNNPPEPIDPDDDDKSDVL